MSSRGGMVDRVPGFVLAKLKLDPAIVVLWPVVWNLKRGFYAVVQGYVGIYEWIP